MVGCTTQRLSSRMRQHVSKYAINLFGTTVLPMQKYGKVYSLKSIGFTAVGYIKVPAGQTTTSEGIIVVASR